MGRLVKKYRLKQQASVSASSKEKDVLRAYKAWCLVVQRVIWVGSKNNEPDQPAPNTSGETPGASPASHFPGPLADVEDGSVSGAWGWQCGLWRWSTGSLCR